MSYLRRDRGQESQVKYGCCSKKHDNYDYDDDVKDDGNDMMCNIVIHSCMDTIILLFNTSSFLYAFSCIFTPTVYTYDLFCLDLFDKESWQHSWLSKKSVSNDKKIGDINALRLFLLQCIWPLLQLILQYNTPWFGSRKYVLWIILWQKCRIF